MHPDTLDVLEGETRGRRQTDAINKADTTNTHSHDQWSSETSFYNCKTIALSLYLTSIFLNNCKVHQLCKYLKYFDNYSKLVSWPIILQIQFIRNKPKLHRSFPDTAQPVPTLSLCPLMKVQPRCYMSEIWKTRCHIRPHDHP